MKLPSRKYNRAASVLEYVILLIMFLAAILLMQKQIARTFFGRWKDLGDTFGYGELYDANTTLECGRYVEHTSLGWSNTEIWYLQTCYEDCMTNGNGMGSCPPNDRDCCAPLCQSTNCNF